MRPEISTLWNIYLVSDTLGSSHEFYGVQALLKDVHY